MFESQYDWMPVRSDHLSERTVPFLSGYSGRSVKLYLPTLTCLNSAVLN